MTGCPQCGSSLPEGRGPKGMHAPVWAVCRNCAWPLNRDKLLGRLIAGRAEVTTVLVVGPGSAGARMLAGGEARAAVDRLAGEADAVVPVCEAAGMVAFRRGDVIEFFLFEGGNVQSALSAMAGL